MSPCEPDARERRLAAKRHNERVRLAAATLNAGCLGLIAAAFIVEAVAAHDVLLEPPRLLWLLVAALLHVLAQAVLGLMRSEE